MMMTIVWTGVALWLGLNAAVAAWCVFATLADRSEDVPDRAHLRLV
jgi:hypothetical protein